ncbi:MAG: CHAT domain-containing protein [Rudaea sp.]
MAEIKYLDLDLRITRTAAGYHAEVLNSPAGQAAADFTLPFSDLELEVFLLRIGGARRKVRRVESSEMEAAKTFGSRLFNAIFAGDVRSTLAGSVSEAERQGAGLRVRLHLAGAPDLGDLPWEYLYNPALNRFLALSVKTPLVRYVDLPERIRPLPVKPPLRVLAMISSPSDVAPLDVSAEFAKLQRALSGAEGSGLVSLEKLESGSLSALQKRLQQNEYHVFHFMGHGEFDDRQQDGVLVLEDEERRGRMVSAQYLGAILHDHSTLRLAVLNSCEGARTSRVDPFAGVAQSLVQQGIPAVIAMQFEIPDEVAIIFAQEFYGALSSGYAVDSALAEARKSIFAQGNEVEWGTPVLYMRAPQGVIFELPGAVTPRKPTVPAPDRPDQAAEQRLARLYTDGLAAAWVEDWDRACQYFEAILSERPNYRNVAAKLEEVKRKRKQNSLYAQASRAQETQDWETAVTALEALVAEAADFKDAAKLLETARKQKQLTGLYGEARQLSQAKQWQAALNALAQVTTLDSTFGDPEGLKATAEQELAKQKREAELEELYSQAVQEMEAGRKAEARKLLAALQENQPDYRETARLIERLDAELAREQAERERAAQIDSLYRAAEADFEDRKFDEAGAALESLLALEPTNTAALVLRDKVQAAQAAQVKEEEAQAAQQARDDQVTDLLRAAEASLLRREYSDTVHAAEQILALAPGQARAAELLETANERLKAQTETPPESRKAPASGTPRWVWRDLIILAALLACGCLISILMSSLNAR